MCWETLSSEGALVIGILLVVGLVGNEEFMLKGFLERSGVYTSRAATHKIIDVGLWACYSECASETVHGSSRESEPHLEEVLSSAILT